MNYRSLDSQQGPQSTSISHGDLRPHLCSAPTFRPAQLSSLPSLPDHLKQRSSAPQSPILVEASQSPHKSGGGGLNVIPIYNKKTKAQRGQVACPGLHSPFCCRSVPPWAPPLPPLHTLSSKFLLCQSLALPMSQPTFAKKAGAGGAPRLQQPGSPQAPAGGRLTLPCPTSGARHLVALTSRLTHCCGKSMGLAIRRARQDGQDAWLSGSFQPPSYVTMALDSISGEPQLPQ